MTDKMQVVVAYDFTPSAEQALARAIEVTARAPQHVLHVVTVLDSRGSLLGHISYDDAEQVQEAVATGVSKAFAGRPTASEVQFFVHARIGKPADEILSVAKEVSADLIFIGSHGKSAIARVLLGSVSQFVVREAQCPVMVVREKTYPHVELVPTVAYEHDRSAFHAPHRYSYSNDRVIKRPGDWPIG